MFVLIIKEPKGDEDASRVTLKGMRPKRRPKRDIVYRLIARRSTKHVWRFDLHAYINGGRCAFSLAHFEVKDALMPNRMESFSRQLSRTEQIPEEPQQRMGRIANRMSRITLDASKMRDTKRIHITLSLGTYAETHEVPWSSIHELYVLE